MTTVLTSLIQQARTELGSTACQSGRHQWTSDGEGGRGCPHDLTDDCSQGVYRCTVCGQYDYGEAGGPGHADCERRCPHRFERALAIMQERRDPLEYSWPRAVRAGHDPIEIHRTLLRALRRQPKARLP